MKQITTDKGTYNVNTDDDLTESEMKELEITGMVITKDGRIIQKMSAAFE